ncbi:MAG: sodium:phosphate symporter [Flammeovirgaceae bacterium]
MQTTQIFTENTIKTSFIKSLRFIVVILIVYVFFVSIELMSRAFGLLGTSSANHILSVTSNPFIGLLIGLLTTAILQSSSVTTAAIVAIVASGTLMVSSAIPIIMGANIGTTVTSTIVALGFLENRKEFRKAIAAATVHDFFNIITVIILFPLELLTSFLSESAAWVTSFLFDLNYLGISGKPFFEFFIKPISLALSNLMPKNALFMIIFAVLMLFFVLKAITYLLRNQYADEKINKLDRFFFRNQYKALATGFLLTAIVQSSSLTTSLIVPLVATNKVYLRKIFPFVMGANIGTTITALFAALSISELAVTIAMVHVLFNVIGTLLHLFTPLGKLPIWLARKLGSSTVKSRWVGFIYILSIFFIIPFLLIYLSK